MLLHGLIATYLPGYLVCCSLLGELNFYLRIDQTRPEFLENVYISTKWFVQGLWRRGSAVDEIGWLAGYFVSVCSGVIVFDSNCALLTRAGAQKLLGHRSVVHENYGHDSDYGHDDDRDEEEDKEGPRSIV